MADVRIDSVTKSFGSVEAVRDLTLQIGNSEFIVLLGPTGAGKTTLLRVVAGLESPERGAVYIDGEDATAAPPAARDVAFVFQQYSLYPHLTVFENLAFPLRSPIRSHSEDEIRETVHRVARMLRIEDKLQNSATRLSGGQMQRVAIGRALVRSPSIYLMDEPLSSLDAKLRAELRIELKRIQSDLGATVLYVTHDQIEAMTLATRIGIMDRGRLVQVGSPREVYTDPVNIYVATRLGMPAINILPCSVFPALTKPANAVSIGLRTEHIRLDTTISPTSAPGRVTWIEHLGDQDYVHVDVAGHNVVILADPDRGVQSGDVIAMTALAPLFFDSAGDRVRL